MRGESSSMSWDLGEAASRRAAASWSVDRRWSNHDDRNFTVCLGCLLPAMAMAPLPPVERGFRGMNSNICLSGNHAAVLDAFVALFWHCREVLFVRL